MSNSPQSKCQVCRKFIPSWDLHLRCISHWDRDCSRRSPCNVCVVWTEAQWVAVDKSVAKIEAKAIQKASVSATKKTRKVSPTDVSGGKAGEES